LGNIVRVTPMAKGEEEEEEDEAVEECECGKMRKSEVL